MDPMDNYIEKHMQNWAARSRPPINSRSRLLRSAAQAAYLRAKSSTSTSAHADHYLVRLLKTNMNRKGSREYSTKFFDWTIVYSFEMSLVNLKLMF